MTSLPNRPLSRHHRWRPIAVAGSVLLGLATSITLAVPASATTSTNLLRNGDAETSQCSPGGWEETTVPGWQLTAGDPVIDCYNSTNSASPTTPGSPTKANAYFQGGSRGSSQLTQTVDVSSAATAIDAGGVPATLSGWLGGVAAYNDAAKVTATFDDATGGALGSTSIGPVLAADRGSTTEFLNKSATATVPAGTRSVKVTVDFTMTGTQNDGLADDLSLTLGTSVTAPTLTVPPSTVPGFDHVFVVMMENNNYSATSNTVDGGAGIIGNSSAPYINKTLVPMGSLLSDYHGGTHNSDPNYEQIAFGNSYGRSAKSGNANCITDPACAATNPGLNDRIDSVGKTWKQYTQSQTSNCQTTNSGNYEADDVPFYYSPTMKNSQSYCDAHWQPLPQLLNTDLASASTTPNFVWFDADSCDDMEGCGIGAGDTWLSKTLPTLFNSPAWTQQKSLLLLTFDEDGNNAPGGFGPGQTNQVLTLAIGSQHTVQAGYVDSSRYDHYSTARVIEGALGLDSMTNNDKWATPYNEVFGVGSPSGPLVDGGTYEIGRSGTNQVIDDPGSSTTSGTQLIVWSNNGGTANQEWTATHNADGTYQLKNGASGYCLDDSGASTAAGNPLIQWTCTGSRNQEWTPTASGAGFALVNAASGLDATPNGTADGSGLVQEPLSQTWTFTRVG